ncbi:MAG TPA: alpha/beta hydrolase [Sphingomicrobium sp.]|jgi:hypothetical protein
MLKLSAFLPAIAFAGSAAAEAPPSAQRYLFYLHGAIVENQGPQGVSPKYGRYDYPGVIGAFRNAGLTVRSEVRPRGTEVNAYADKVVAEVRSLIASGVDPSHVTVVGASKGAVIAALVSTRLSNAKVRYVLLANCNPWLIRTHNPRLSGEVLSIYESSDEIGGSCAGVLKRSPAVTRFKEVRLQTGLGHGIVYRPLKQWTAPAIAWAKR